MLATSAVMSVIAHSFDAERHCTASNPAPEANKAHAGEPLRLRGGVLDFSTSALLTHWTENETRGARLLQFLQVIVVLLCLH